MIALLPLQISTLKGYTSLQADDIVTTIFCKSICSDVVISLDHISTCLSVSILQTYRRDLSGQLDVLDNLD